MKTAIVVIALLIAGPALADQTCKQEVGGQKAQMLVDRCLEVSEATHPPCNADNPCAMMVDEIKRGCAALGDSADTPKYCGQYKDSGY